jgi:NAD(P)-dependent dehydrogenase (short-subunit alcohol dehydrogenase family)
MTTYFADKICVVTGAGSGIGRATALELARYGAAHLVMADINRENLEATHKLVREAGASANIVQLDVANREAMYELAEQTLAKHGRADFVLNNAGIANIAPVESLAIEDFERVMNVDFWGVVHGTQAFLPAMIKRNFGHIANISSIFGFIGVPNLPSMVLPRRCGKKCMALASRLVASIQAGSIPRSRAMRFCHKARIAKNAARRLRPISNRW